MTDRTHTLRVLLLLAVAAATAISHAREPAPSQLTVDLRDGSRLIGTPEPDALLIATDLGEINLPFSKIASLTAEPADKRLALVLANDNRLTGAPGKEPLRIRTILGDLNVPWELVTKINVSLPLEERAQFSAAKDFSGKSNPNSPWSYGTLGADADNVFRLFSERLPEGTEGGIEGWRNPNEGPSAVRNAGAELLHPCGTLTMKPGQLNLHPGSSGDRSCVRWTAPRAGKYKLAGAFTGLSGYQGAQPTTTDVAVLNNGKPIFSSWINLHDKGNDAPFAEEFDLRTGDTIDFVVGLGNGNYGYDSTGLDATLVPLSQPE